MRALVLLLLLAKPAAACVLALMFAVDVSGSVDPNEYRIQMEGLAEGLRDRQIAESLLSGKAALSLVQWTGMSRQKVTLPWVQIASHDDLEAFASAVADDQRVWRNFSTAIGEGLRVAGSSFDAAPTCSRNVIDVSGDGVSNEGAEPAQLRALNSQKSIAVNALVIEDATAGDLTGYYYENVIFGPGAFVVTADRYAEYPEMMRCKLLREVTQVVGALELGD
ncbi:MAG: DUF1194 domain-containing protein [Rhodobacteraceae bacterium]|nr:DUF1194 domain-containing protein [Paracoccaceae bacterium]